MVEELAGFDRRFGGFEEDEKVVFEIDGTLAPGRCSLLKNVELQERYFVTAGAAGMFPKVLARQSTRGTGMRIQQRFYKVTFHCSHANYEKS